MSISNNIAKYRKQKGYTQEQLGEFLGVTNQAVSKWESAISMPDVMLLPKIADVLGISLERLYGIDKTVPESNVSRSDFYKDTNRIIIGLLYDQIGDRIMFPCCKLYENTRNLHSGKIDRITDNRVFKLYSDTSGFAYISGNMSIIDSEYDCINDGSVFENHDVYSVLRKISDKNVIKVMTYLYTEAFKDLDVYRMEAVFAYKDFIFDTLLENCNIDEAALSDALDKLISLNIVEKYMENQIVKYQFYKPKAVQLAVILKIVDRFAYETHSWEMGAPDMLTCNYCEKDSDI